MRSDTDVMRGGLGCSKCRQFFSGVEVRLLCTPLKFFHSNFGKLWTVDCAQGHCDARIGFGRLVAAKGNSKATEYICIMDNFVAIRPPIPLLAICVCGVGVFL